MNLYMLSQSDNTWYDTYDSCIVAAETEDAARMIHPGSGFGPHGHGYVDKSWANSPESVSVSLIGQAKEGMEAGIVLASFNAG